MKKLLIIVLLFCNSFAVAQEGVDITPLLKKITTMASSGDAEAAYHLGMLNINGIGVEQDQKEGLRWIKIAANKNSVLGAYELGNFYSGAYGDAIETNAEEAFRNKRFAADAGYALAQYDIGILYLNHNNGKQGAKFLEKAATQGNLTAYQTLSLLKFRGDMIERDLIESRSYLVLLKNSLDPENAAQFIPIITQIEGDLSPEQITESDKFVSNWKTQETEISIIANKGLIRTYEHAGIKAPSN